MKNEFKAIVMFSLGILTAYWAADSKDMTMFCTSVLIWARFFEHYADIKD